jgi:predicted nucleic acid-binding protein
LSERGGGILVDTSVWIEFFKQRSEIGSILETLILDNSVWVCGVVLFELMQGVKSDREKSLIKETLSTLEYVEMTTSLWLKAADLSASLKKKGITVPLSDIFLAVIAIEHNLQIFTLDKHFERIPGVKLYKS